MGKLRATNSYQNIVLLALLVIGLLVLYRYIKNVESDTKVMNNNMLELSKKIQLLTKSLHEENAQTETQMYSGEQVVHTSHENQTNAEELEDTESIQSEEITNMLRKVMGTDNEFDDIDIIINNIQKESVYEEEYCQDSPKIKIIEENVEDISSLPETTEKTDKVEVEVEYEEDIILTKASVKDDLTKKTNEELKMILKEKGLNIKGNKTELVDRILNA